MAHDDSELPWKEGCEGEAVLVPRWAGVSGVYEFPLLLARAMPMYVWLLVEAARQGMQEEGQPVCYVTREDLQRAWPREGHYACATFERLEEADFLRVQRWQGDPRWRVRLYWATQPPEPWTAVQPRTPSPR